MADYKNDIDFTALAQDLMLHDVCRPKLNGLAKALVFGLGYVYTIAFRAFYKRVDLHLSITPQVWSLEKHLNDRFDYTLRRIYIENGQTYDPANIYLTAELKPLPTYLDTEDKPIGLRLATESGFTAVSFRVKVPADKMNNKTAITAWVNKYKLAGKSFDVTEI